VIIPDVNLLLYAYSDAYPQHEKAREWWEDQVNSDIQIGLADPVIYGFLRIGTNPRIFEVPMSIDEAAGYIETMLAEANIIRAPAGPQTFDYVLRVLRDIGTGGNLTTDAQIAGLAIEWDATVCSNDADFGRFPGVKWTNPLAG
jgi:toxin-antitoxin system PIN domain toxin